MLARAVYYHYKRLRVNIPEQEKQEQSPAVSGNYEQRVKSMKSPKGMFNFFAIIQCSKKNKKAFWLTPSSVKICLCFFSQSQDLLF